MYKAIPYIYGAKAIPTFYFLLLLLSKIKIVNQLNQQLFDLLTIFYDIFINCEPYIITLDAKVDRQ